MKICSLYLLLRLVLLVLMLGKPYHFSHILFKILCMEYLSLSNSQTHREYSHFVKIKANVTNKPNKLIHDRYKKIHTSLSGITIQNIIGNCFRRNSFTYKLQGIDTDKKR